MKHLYLWSLLAFLATILPTCKKGPDDPSISLRSRKARVVGKWHMKNGSVSVTDQDNSKAPYNYLFTFDGSKCTENVTQYNNAPVIYTFAYLLSVEFKRDGTFTMKETLGSESLDASGTWNFTGGIGEDKNKERITMLINTVYEGATGGNNHLHLFNKNDTEFTFKIRELRNKTMVLEAANEVFIDSKGAHQDYSGSYLLIQ